jgi:hypothetical protein
VKVKRPAVNRLADLERSAEIRCERAFQDALRGGDRERAMRAARRLEAIAAKSNGAALKPVAPLQRF